MIIEKTGLSKDDIVVLKPLAGLDVIAKLQQDYTSTDDSVVVKNPLEAHPVPHEHGGVGLALMPYSLSARDEQVFRFDMKHILFVVPARQEVLDSYRQQTSSLVLPKLHG